MCKDACEENSHDSKIATCFIFQTNQYWTLKTQLNQTVPEMFTDFISPVMVCDKAFDVCLRARLSDLGLLLKIRSSVD